MEGRTVPSRWSPKKSVKDQGLLGGKEHLTGSGGREVGESRGEEGTHQESGAFLKRRFLGGGKGKFPLRAWWEGGGEGGEERMLMSPLKLGQKSR